LECFGVVFRRKNNDLRLISFTIDAASSTEVSDCPSHWFFWPRANECTFRASAKATRGTPATLVMRPTVPTNTGSSR